jgi:hypothetical protein
MVSDSLLLLRELPVRPRSLLERLGWVICCPLTSPGLRDDVSGFLSHSVTPPITGSTDSRSFSRGDAARL